MSIIVNNKMLFLLVFGVPVSLMIYADRFLLCRENIEEAETRKLLYMVYIGRVGIYV